MVTDPVCGETFTEEEGEALGAEKLVRDGKTLWFCGPFCRDMYAKDPERYAREAAGGRHAH